MSAYAAKRTFKQDPAKVSCGSEADCCIAQFERLLSGAVPSSTKRTFRSQDRTSGSGQNRTISERKKTARANHGRRAALLG